MRLTLLVSAILVCGCGKLPPDDDLAFLSSFKFTWETDAETGEAGYRIQGDHASIMRALPSLGAPEVDRASGASPYHLQINGLPSTLVVPIKSTGRCILLIDSNR